MHHHPVTGHIVMIIYMVRVFENAARTSTACEERLITARRACEPDKKHRRSDLRFLAYQIARFSILTRPQPVPLAAHPPQPSFGFQTTCRMAVSAS